MKKIMGLSILQWILCVGGIVVLSSFIIFPPVFRTVFAVSTEPGENDQSDWEDPVNNGTSTGSDLIDDSQYERIICTYNDESNTDYRDSLGILFFHEDNQLRIVSETVNRVYPLDTKDNEAKFAEAQLACQETPTSYHQVKGFNYECSTGGNSIYTVKKFDLATFDSTSVSASDQEVITTNYTLNQNVSELASQLEAAGYVCE
ncbi:MAG TPA: hypothetical protein IAB56_04510 [Candidatus Scybalousia intestinigallinarum]|nr:hypothetical protein [Candidatus Scybalousia intestinigallinarum]